MKRGLFLLGLIACGGTKETEIPISTVGLPLAFCGSDVPVWMAYQNDASAWTRVRGDASNVFHVPIGARGGIATLHGSVTLGLSLDVEYGTAAELSANHLSCSAATAQVTKSVSGTVAGLSTGDTASVALGPTEIITQNTVFSLNGLPAGPHDLV